MTLSIRRIDCRSSDALAAIAELRRELSPKGNVVSPEGRARTIAAFGKPLAPVQVVERICTDVAARGLAAVLDYTRRLDGVALEPAAVRVSRAELQAAHESADAGYLQTLENVRATFWRTSGRSSTRTWGSSPPRASSWVFAMCRCAGSVFAYRAGPRPIHRRC